MNHHRHIVFQIVLIITLLTRIYSIPPLQPVLQFQSVVHTNKHPLGTEAVQKIGTWFQRNFAPIFAGVQGINDVLLDFTTFALRSFDNMLLSPSVSIFSETVSKNSKDVAAQARAKIVKISAGLQRYQHNLPPLPLDLIFYYSDARVKQNTQMLLRYFKYHVYMNQTLWLLPRGILIKLARSLSINYMILQHSAFYARSVSGSKELTYQYMGIKTGQALAFLADLFRIRDHQFKLRNTWSKLDLREIEGIPTIYTYGITLDQEVFAELPLLSFQQQSELKKETRRNCEANIIYYLQFALDLLNEPLPCPLTYFEMLVSLKQRIEMCLHLVQYQKIIGQIYHDANFDQPDKDGEPSQRRQPTPTQTNAIDKWLNAWFVLGQMQGALLDLMNKHPELCNFIPRKQSGFVPKLGSYSWNLHSDSHFDLQLSRIRTTKSKIKRRENFNAEQWRTLLSSIFWLRLVIFLLRIENTSIYAQQLIDLTQSLALFTQYQKMQTRFPPFPSQSGRQISYGDSEKQIIKRCLDFIHKMHTFFVSHPFYKNPQHQRKFFLYVQAVVDDYYQAAFPQRRIPLNYNRDTPEFIQLKNEQQQLQRRITALNSQISQQNLLVYKDSFDIPFPHTMWRDNEQWKWFEDVTRIINQELAELIKLSKPDRIAFAFQLEEMLIALHVIALVCPTSLFIRIESRTNALQKRLQIIMKQKNRHFPGMPQLQLPIIRNIMTVHDFDPFFSSLTRIQREMLGTFENDPFALTMLYQGLLAYLQRFLQFCHLMAKSNWSRQIHKQFQQINIKLGDRYRQMGEIWQKNAMKLGQNSKTYELISSIDIGTFRMMLPFIWDGQGQSMIKWAKQAYQQLGMEMSVFIKQGSNCMLRSEYGRNLQYQAIMFLIQLEMTMAVERNQAINTVFGGFINKIRDLLSKLMTEILKRENLEQQYNVKTLSIDFQPAQGTHQHASYDDQSMPALELKIPKPTQFIYIDNVYIQSAPDYVMLGRVINHANQFIDMITNLAMVNEQIERGILLYYRTWVKIYGQKILTQPIQQILKDKIRYDMEHCKERIESKLKAVTQKRRNLSPQQQSQLINAARDFHGKNYQYPTKSLLEKQRCGEALRDLSIAEDYLGKWEQLVQVSMVSGGDKAVIKEMSFQRPKNTLQDVLLVISKVEHHIWKLMVNLDFSKSPSYSQHVNEQCRHIKERIQILRQRCKAMYAEKLHQEFLEHQEKIRRQQKQRLEKIQQQNRAKQVFQKRLQEDLRRKNLGQDLDSSSWSTSQLQSDTSKISTSRAQGMRDLSYRTHYDSLTDRVTAGTSFGSLSTGTDITTTTSQTRPLSLDTIQTDIQSHVQTTLPILTSPTTQSFDIDSLSQIDLHNQVLIARKMRQLHQQVRKRVRDVTKNTHKSTNQVSKIFINWLKEPQTSQQTTKQLKELLKTLQQKLERLHNPPSYIFQETQGQQFDRVLNEMMKMTTNIEKTLRRHLWKKTHIDAGNFQKDYYTQKEPINKQFLQILNKHPPSFSYTPGEMLRTTNQLSFFDNSVFTVFMLTNFVGIILQDSIIIAEIQFIFPQTGIAHLKQLLRRCDKALQIIEDMKRSGPAKYKNNDRVPSDQLTTVQVNVLEAMKTQIQKLKKDLQKQLREMQERMDTTNILRTSTGLPLRQSQQRYESQPLYHFWYPEQYQFFIKQAHNIILYARYVYAQNSDPPFNRDEESINELQRLLDKIILLIFYCRAAPTYSIYSKKRAFGQTYYTLVTVYRILLNLLKTRKRFPNYDKPPSDGDDETRVPQSIVSTSESAGAAPYSQPDQFGTKSGGKRPKKTKHIERVQSHRSTIKYGPNEQPPQISGAKKPTEPGYDSNIHGVYMQCPVPEIGWTKHRDPDQVPTYYQASPPGTVETRETHQSSSYRPYKSIDEYTDEEVSSLGHIFFSHEQFSLPQVQQVRITSQPFRGLSGPGRGKLYSRRIDMRRVHGLPQPQIDESTMEPDELVWQDDMDTDSHGAQFWWRQFAGYDIDMGAQSSNRRTSLYSFSEYGHDNGQAFGYANTGSGSGMGYSSGSMFHHGGDQQSSSSSSSGRLFQQYPHPQGQTQGQTRTNQQQQGTFNTIIDQATARRRAYQQSRPTSPSENNQRFTITHNIDLSRDYLKQGTLSPPNNQQQKDKNKQPKDNSKNNQ